MCTHASLMCGSAVRLWWLLEPSFVSVRSSGETVVWTRFEETRASVGFKFLRTCCVAVVAIICCYLLCFHNASSLGRQYEARRERDTRHGGNAAELMKNVSRCPKAASREAAQELLVQCLAIMYIVEKAKLGSQGEHYHCWAVFRYEI